VSLSSAILDVFDDELNGVMQIEAEKHISNRKLAGNRRNLKINRMDPWSRTSSDDLEHGNNGTSHHLIIHAKSQCYWMFVPER
jgi:hypothetical protein